MGFLLAVLYYYIRDASWLLSYPHQMDFGEGFTMGISKLWAEGNWNWDINQTPYLTMMYGPVFYMLTVPLIKVFGYSLMLGRIVEFGATIGSLVFILLIVKQLTKNWYVAMVTALLPLSIPIIRDWSFQARVDMLASMFSLAGVYVVIRFKGKGIYASLPLFLLAFFTKQTAIAGVIAVGLYLLWKERGKAIPFALGFIVPLVAIIGISSLVTGGEFFKHLFTYNSTSPVFWEWWIVLINFMAAISAGIILVGIAILELGNKWHDKQIGIPELYFLATMGIYLTTMWREGSYVSYAIPAIYATCILAGLWLNKFPYRLWGKRSAAVNLMLIIMIALPIVRFANNCTIPRPDERYTQQAEYVQELIADADSPIPTENAGLILNAGKELCIEPFVFTNLMQLGIWDDSNYLANIRNKRFDYLVLRAATRDRAKWGEVGRVGDEHLSLITVKAIEENYEVIYNPDGEKVYWYNFCVYAPKQGQQGKEVKQ